MKRLLLTMLLAGCAAERAAPQATDVGITVLPVASSTTRAPLAHVEVMPAETSAPPRTGDRAAAERYFTEARSALAAGRVPEACSLFAKSLEAEPAIGTMFNLADCNEKLGNLSAACNAYRDVEVQARGAGQDSRGELARSRAEKLGCR